MPAGLRAEISRDAWGIPHVYAESDAALFHAYGYAMAQDRLFQLDYLRRKARGTLAEVLGPDGLELARYHYLPMDPTEVAKTARHTLTLG